MAKVVKLKEADLTRLVNKVLEEQMDVSSDSEHYVRRKREITMERNNKSNTTFMWKSSGKN
jgi:hypothetical protein